MAEQDNPIMKLQQQRMLERIDGMKDAFKSMALNDVRQITERLFITYFLPFFSGEKVENAEALMDHWTVIAGTVYNPVNVMDEQGRFVIQVPALNNINIFKPILDRNQDISYAIKLAKEKSSISPLLGANIMSSELGLRMDTMLKNADTKEEALKWEALFKHYGKLPTTKTAVTQQGSDDEFEY